MPRRARRRGSRRWVAPQRAGSLRTSHAVCTRLVLGSAQSLRCIPLYLRYVFPLYRAQAATRRRFSATQGRVRRMRAARLAARWGGVADALTDEQERNGLVGHHGREAHPLVRRRDDAVVLHRRLDRREVLGLRLLHQFGVRPHPLDGWSGQAKESRRRSRIATPVRARLRLTRPVRARGAALQWSCNQNGVAATPARKVRRLLF